MGQRYEGLARKYRSSLLFLVKKILIYHIELKTSEFELALL